MRAFAAEIINLTFLVHGGLLLSSQSEATHRSAHARDFAELSSATEPGAALPAPFMSHTVSIYKSETN
jgi:hypothetical protein